MQILELDFHARRASSPWVGRVLLALAVAFAVDVTAAYLRAREAVEASESQLARLGRPVEGSSGPVQRVSPEEMRTAHETIERLSLAWDNLFAALESSPAGDIALLSIEPDPRSGTALISGEARDYASVIQYVSRLGEAKTLKDVYLVRHEMRPGEQSRRPLAFSVSAEWREAR